jgi:phospholipid-binding lipoprotein MlaA
VIKKFLFTLILITTILATPITGFASDDFSDDEFESYESGNDFKIHDPLEKLNRKIYVFNDYLDIYFLQHVAILYRKNIPKPARRSIRNVFTNLSLPSSALNSLLQGKIDNSLATFSHFLINSTLGLGGIFDIAGEKGIRYKNEDFGQTLGHYGVKSGPYLMLPILGPSNLRDFTGYAADKTIGPLDFNALEIGGNDDLIEAKYRIGLAAVSGVDKRESLIEILDDVRQESFDPYATIRSAYLQKRLTDIKN